MVDGGAASVIIVGTGPGGLASALLLAHSGVKVTMVEKADAVGGRTRIIEKDGRESESKGILSIDLYPLPLFSIIVLYVVSLGLELFIVEISSDT